MSRTILGMAAIVLGACSSSSASNESGACPTCDGAEQLSARTQALLPIQSGDRQSRCGNAFAQRYGESVFGVEAEQSEIKSGAPSKLYKDVANGRTSVKFLSTSDEIELPVTFHETGQYRLMLRARGFSASSDSVFVTNTYPAGTTASFAVQFGRQDAVFFWLDSGVTYDIDASKLHKTDFVRIRGRELDAEVDSIALVKEGSGASPDAPFAQTQTAGTSVFAFPAEAVDSINDPDADGNVFSRQDGGIAQGWDELRAPALAGIGTDESRARYRVKFTDAGTYALYLRGRGQNTSTDSVLAAAGFNAAPSVAVGFATGTFGWVTTAGLNAFVVTQADVNAGKVFDLEVGVREADTELDSIAFVRQGTTVTNALLDAAMGHFEAETATLSGTSLTNHSLASGGKRVVGFGEVGDSIDFGNLAPKDGRLHIRYSLERIQAKQASVYLDEVDIGSASFATTGSWDEYATTFVYLPHAGQVRLQIDADDYVTNLKDSSASIDRVTVSEGPAPCLLNLDQNYSTELAGAQAGDTYVVPNGTYSAQNHTISVNGTADRPITLRAQTAGHVFFEGDSALWIDSQYGVIDGFTFRNGSTSASSASLIIALGSSSEHSRVTNTTIEGWSGDRKRTWAEVFGRHNRFDHNHLVGKTNEGDTLYAKHRTKTTAEPERSKTYNVIDANYFGTRPAGDEGDKDVNGWETLRTGVSTDSRDPAYLQVKNNLFYRCNGEIEVVSNKSSNNYYFYNTFRENQGGLVMRQGHDVHIEGNVFLGGPPLTDLNQKYPGIRLHGENHTVINNYFQDTDAGIEFGYAQAGLTPTSTPGCNYFPVTNVLLAHNTMIGVRNPAFWVSTDEPCGTAAVVAPSNIFVINNFTNGAAYGEKHPEFASDFRYDTNVTSVAARPVGWTLATWALAADATGLLRPTAAHPGRAPAAWPSGFPASPVTLDVDGRPRDSAPDIGADEFNNGSSNSHVPLTAADVGPRWGDRSTVF